MLEKELIEVYDAILSYKENYCYGNRYNFAEFKQLYNAWKEDNKSFEALCEEFNYDKDKVDRDIEMARNYCLLMQY